MSQGVIANGKQDARYSSSAKHKKMATALFEPDPIEKLNWLIHLQHIRGETVKCKELIKNEINKTKGKHEYAYFKQGVILREEKKIQEALESFQICYKLNNENTDNIKEVAKCLFLLRKYRLSLDAYFEAEKAFQKPDWEIYHNIGQCLMFLGEEEKAQDYARQAVHLGKQECSYSLLIKLLIGKGDLLSAITVCSAALDACPDSTNMLTEAGLLYLKAGQTQKAFESLSLALALDSSCSQALLGIGCITQAHEEYDVALSKYKVAVQMKPDSVALWNNIGMCFYSKQKYIAAISCLKRALWLSPLNWKVLLNLGLVHLQTLQPASAFNFLCAAVNLRPDVGLTFMALGSALFELKDTENSLRAFRQAALLSKDDLSTILNISLALTISGSDIEASEFLNKFKLLTQEDEQIDKQLLDLGARLETLLSQQTRESANKTEKSKQHENVDGNISLRNETSTLTLDPNQKRSNIVATENSLKGLEENDEDNVTHLAPDEV